MWLPLSARFKISIDVPSRRFSHIHIDLTCPLLEVRDYTHVFTVVDRSTNSLAAYLV